MSTGNTIKSWIACASETPRLSFAATVRVCWPLVCGENALASAWLEDPLHADGLQLRDAALDPEDPDGGLSLPAAQILVETWPDGRIFGKQGELRWESRPDGSLDMVLTSDSAVPQSLPDGFGDKLDLEQLGDETLLLWGNRERGSWSEERIPQLSYPQSWKGLYAAIDCRGYLHKAGSERDYSSWIVRYCGFQGNYNPSEEHV